MASISSEGCPKNHGKTGEVDSNLPEQRQRFSGRPTGLGLHSNPIVFARLQVMFFFFFGLYIYISLLLMVQKSGYHQLRLVVYPVGLGLLPTA